MNYNERLLQKAANVLSLILHPLWLPTAVLVILFSSDTYLDVLPWDIRRFDLIIVAVNTLFIPLAYTVIFYRLKMISSFRMEKKEERNLPLLLYIVFTYVSYIVLKKVQQPSLIWQIVLIISATTFFAFLVNLKWKISLHMIGIGGFSGIMLILVYRLDPVFVTLWLISIFLSGILGVARLLSRQHTPVEIYTGFLGGFFISAGFLWFMS